VSAFADTGVREGGRSAKGSRGAISIAQNQDMRGNKLSLFVHFVWATWDRLPLITPEVERRLLRNIEDVAIHHKCEAIAINAVPDHVHVLLKIPSTFSIADLVKHMKGVSSNFANDELFTGLTAFKWQGSYGAFSVSRWDIDRVKAYVLRQKEHHNANELEEELEAVMDEQPGD